MNALDSQLYWFSALFAFITGLQIVIPFLFFRRDAFTAWNFFLVGSLIFTGLSGINATRHAHYLPEYTPADYYRFFMGVIVFYTTISFVYYLSPVPRWLSQRTMLRFPPINTSMLYLVCAAIIPLAALRFVPITVPVVAQVMFYFGFQIPNYLVGLTFIAWLRNPLNVVSFALMGAAFGFSFIFSVSSGSGRLFLLATIMTLPTCYYWSVLRYQSVPSIAFKLGGYLIAGVFVLGAYTTVRHADTGAQGFARGAAMVQRIGERFTAGRFDDFMGQDSVDCALSTIHLVHDRSKRLEMKPLYGLYWMIVNPIPRSMWPEKPESLGVILPNAMELHRRGMVLNLGVNVVGQGYHDGGLPTLVLYAILFGTYLRYIDLLLLTRPGNPYILVMFSASCSQLLAWPRGSIDGYSMFLVCYFVFMWVIVNVGRIVFGTAIDYSETLSPKRRYMPPMGAAAHTSS